MNQDRFAKAVAQIKPGHTFETDKFDVSIAVVFEQNGGAADRGRYRSGGNLRATGSFRHIKEHRAAAEIHVARAFVKTENRVGAEPCNRLIGKRELATRIRAGTHGRAIAHRIIHHCRTRRRLRREQLHFANDLGHGRFLQLRGYCRSCDENERERNKSGAGEREKDLDAQRWFHFLKAER